MTLPKEVEVNLPTEKVEEIKQEEKFEQQVEGKTKRTREDVEEMFIEHYNIEDEEVLKKLVDRELSSGKSFAKLIRQKRKLRDELLKDGPKEKKEIDKEEKSSFDKIRSIERTKAVQEFLGELSKKYPNNFKTKDDVKSAYEKIKIEYKEAGEETRREDFIKNLEKAFKVSHPEIYENEIATKERKRLLEEDVDIDSLSTPPEGEPKKSKKRKFLGNTKVNVKDWYKPKK